MDSRSLFGVALLLGLGCSTYNKVSLEFADVPTGDGDVSVPHGFFCKVDGRPLAAVASEAAGEATGRACIVTDLIYWNSRQMPGCRPAELLNFCRKGENDCEPIRRGVVDVDLPDGGTFAERVAQTLATVRGKPAEVYDTPALPLVVRVFATFQPCADLDPGEAGDRISGHDQDLVFGCAYSCPVWLDDVRGEILLDLDSFDPECGRSVRACSSNDFAREADAVPAQ
ncbi:MAG: hypothetical protein HYY06_05870 [Deltaproteobacteria bacterium]|nr:hypothetical protein [Deltaproteobacteria bacterium]